MSSPSKFYMRHMNQKTKYRATWVPNKKLEIGQVGKIDRSGVFNVFTSLAKESIPVETSSDEASGDFDYTSNESVTIRPKLQGEIPLAGSPFTELDAGFSIDFKSDKSVVFQIGGVKTYQLTNLWEIEQQILQRYASGGWDKDLLIITELIEAASGTIIISNSSDAGIDLKAKAGIGTGKLSLTDVSLGLSVARERGSTVKYLPQSTLTPLYRVMGIRHPLIGKPGIGTKSLGQKIQETPDRLTYQEFHEEEID